jgi:hypothetical protein
MRIHRLLAVLVFAPLACSEPTQPSGGLRVETSATIVLPGQQFTYTVVNGTTDTVVLAACCSISARLDRRVGPAWVQVNTPTALCLANCVAARVLLPGQSDGGPVRISEPGTFRLRLGRMGGNDIAWDVTSNSVRVQPVFVLLRESRGPSPTHD